LSDQSENFVFPCFGVITPDFPITSETRKGHRACLCSASCQSLPTLFFSQSHLLPPVTPSEGFSTRYIYTRRLFIVLPGFLFWIRGACSYPYECCIPQALDFHVLDFSGPPPFRSPTPFYSLRTLDPGCSPLVFSLNFLTAPKKVELSPALPSSRR